MRCDVYSFFDSPSKPRGFLAEAILLSTHNIGFYEDLTKIIFELSSNIIKYALISSAGSRSSFATEFSETEGPGLSKFI